MVRIGTILFTKQHFQKSINNKHMENFDVSGTTTSWNNHGGRRSNAGRKPSGIKKQPVTIYVEQHIVDKYGRSEFRQKLYEFTKTISNDIG